MSILFFFLIPLNMASIIALLSSSSSILMMMILLLWLVWIDFSGRSRSIQSKIKMYDIFFSLVYPLMMMREGIMRETKFFFPSQVDTHTHTRWTRNILTDCFDSRMNELNGKKHTQQQHPNEWWFNNLIEN